jgi:O-antigen ligase
MPALVVSLVLTSTRSAWVGATAGVGMLFLLRDFRLMGILPIAAAIFIALSPTQFTDRMYSIFDLNDPTSRDRVAMLQAGVAIVEDHPLTGVGPDMVRHVYPEYRVATAVQESNIHLHNVPMQIAAERGLPALAMWLWFIGSLLWGLKPLVDRSRQRPLASVAVAVTVAMLLAGLFEYNFGDSEFLMLFLILVTLPFAADRS